MFKKKRVRIAVVDYLMSFVSREFPNPRATASDGGHGRVGAGSRGSDGGLRPLGHERTANVNTGRLQSQPGRDRHIRLALLFSSLHFSSLFFIQ